MHPVSCTVTLSSAQGSIYSGPRNILWSGKYHTDDISLAAKMGTNFHFNVFWLVYEFSRQKNYLCWIFLKSYTSTIINWLLWITSSESLYIKNSELKENISFSIAGRFYRLNHQEALNNKTIRQMIHQRFFQPCKLDVCLSHRIGKTKAIFACVSSFL